jgi:hypothetical protein
MNYLVEEIVPVEGGLEEQAVADAQDFLHVLQHGTGGCGSEAQNRNPRKLLLHDAQELVI